MYRDFGENISIGKHVIVELDKVAADKTVVRFQFHQLEQGDAVVVALRDAADRMEKELAVWRQAQAEGKWL